MARKVALICDEENLDHKYQVIAAFKRLGFTPYVFNLSRKGLLRPAPYDQDSWEFVVYINVPEYLIQSFRAFSYAINPVEIQDDCIVAYRFVLDDNRFNVQRVTGLPLGKQIVLYDIMSVVDFMIRTTSGESMQRG